MYILDSIFRGDITPKEKILRKGTEAARCTARLGEDGENLIDELTERGKEILQSYEKHQADLNYITEQDSCKKFARLSQKFKISTIALFDAVAAVFISESRLVDKCKGVAPVAYRITIFS